MSDKEQEVRYACRDQYRRDGTTDMPSEYRSNYHSRMCWLDESLQILMEDINHGNQ